jgi:tRNA-binding EMAP/Myf-like protein
MTTPLHISYDTFASLDIRVGTIVAIEPVPDTDKLLKLRITHH